MSEYVKVPKSWAEALKTADGDTGIQLVEDLQSGKIDVQSDLDDSNWKAFDHSQSINGFFWVAGTYPEMDVDVDDQGQSVGHPTGKSVPYISLIYLDYEPEEGFLEAEPLDRLGWPFEEGYGIQFIMPLGQPNLPKDLIQ